MSILQEQLVELKENLSFKEVLVTILAGDQKVLRNKFIPLVKVLWKNYSQEELLGREKRILDSNIQIFCNVSKEYGANFEDKISFRREEL